MSVQPAAPPRKRSPRCGKTSVLAATGAPLFAVERYDREEGTVELADLPPSVRDVIHRGIAAEQA